MFSNSIRKFSRRFIAFCEYTHFKLIKTMLGTLDAVTILERCLPESALKILQSEGAQIGLNCDFHTPVSFHNVKDFSKLHIGTNTHIGKKVFFDLASGIDIGNNTTISMGCMLLTHIDVGQSQWKQRYPRVEKQLKIGNNVYIGAGAIILPGSCICDDVMVGAGSVVAKSIEIPGRYYGNPAILHVSH